jgi:hypothetical protein
MNMMEERPTSSQGSIVLAQGNLQDLEQLRMQGHRTRMAGITEISVKPAGTRVSDDMGRHNRRTRFMDAWVDEGWFGVSCANHQRRPNGMTDPHKRLARNHTVERESPTRPPSSTWFRPDI